MMARKIHHTKRFEKAFGIESEAKNITSFPEALRRYYGYHELQNSRPATLVTIKSTFSDFCKYKNFETVNEINQQDIEEYLSYCLKRNAPITVNRKLATLRALFNYLVKVDILSKNPASAIDKIKSDSKRRLAVTDEVHEKAIKQLDLTKFSDVRTMVLVTLLKNTGLRLGEAHDLRIQNLNFEERLIMLDKTKNRFWRNIPMTKEVYEKMKVWLDIRGNLPHDYVFVTESNKHISMRNLSQSIKRFFQAVGNEEFSAHCYRHAFVSKLVSSGVPLPVIAEITGHRQLEEILTYTHIDETEKFNAMKNL